MSPEISVVIPTYNRLEVLPEVLAALLAQRAAPSYELVVVNDGSSDGTRAWLDGWLRRTTSHGIPCRVLHQENSGPAAARNLGVEVAEGRWVAFLGDDTVPTPGWLAAHRQAHRQRGDLSHVAVIGYTQWHPRMRLNPFLHYINEYGLQFGYSLIKDVDDVPFNFFYTSNLSLHRDLLRAEPFDLRFPYAAWEDIETSYRLSRRHGMRLTYEPGAVVLHDHPTRIERFCARQEKAGYSGVVFYGLHPELGSFVGVGPDGPPPIPDGATVRWREKLVRALQKFPVKLPRLWEETLRVHYIRGLHRGWGDEAHLRKGEAS